MKKRDLTNLVFHNLTVLYEAGSTRSGSIRWLCKCSCGSEKVVSSDHLTRKKNTVKSCGCQKIRSGHRHSQWKGCGEISGNWWYNHVLRERKQNERVRVPVTITIEYAWELFLKQERKCSLTGMDIVIANDGTASIDRIDSSKGYEEGNIQWVHKDINFMKRTYSQQYFIDMCRRVADHCEIR